MLCVKGRGVLSIVTAVVLASCGPSLDDHCDPEDMYDLPTPDRSRGHKPAATVTIGREGDHWLDTMQYQRVTRAHHRNAYGYAVTYPSPDGGEFTLFWTREQIDFRGTSPRYRLGTIEINNGRILYPDKITRQSLRDVYEAIHLIERAYARQMDGAIAAAEMFGVISALGGVAPLPRPSSVGAAHPKQPLTRATAGSKSASSDVAKAGAAAPEGGTGVLAQLTPNSCGPTCAAMLLSERGINVFRSQVASRTGVLTSAESLARGLNALDEAGHWIGSGVTTSSFGALNRTGSWAAMLWRRGEQIGHWVVVDGVQAGKVVIRDPASGKLSMSVREFMERWNGFAVWRK